MEHVLLWFHGKFLCNCQLTRSIIGFRDCALASRVGVNVKRFRSNYSGTCTSLWYTY